MKWKADIGWNGNCELLSYASCASAVRSFSLLYEGRARDTTVYPDGNPFHDQTMVNQATVSLSLYHFFAFVYMRQHSYASPDTS